MGLSTPCAEYAKFEPSWRKTRDVAAGPIAVKGARDKYLPKGYMTDAQYTDYLERAYFVGYVDKIIDYGAGQLLRNDPAIKGIPDDIANNIDLCGNSISDMVDHMFRELSVVERIGIWHDYSEQKARPYVVTVKAENIIKWNYGYLDSGEKVLTSVVLLSEDASVDPTTYDVVTEPRVIVLYLDDAAVFHKATYKIVSKNDGKTEELIEDIVPVAGIGGKPLNYIPFKIVSAKGTPEHIHSAPMHSVAEVNLSLYRSMASREQLLFYYGMPTGVAKGWEKKDPFPIGGVAAFDKDGDFHFAQIQVGGEVDKAIADKKEEIAQLGSSFLSGRGRYVASAETSQNNREGDEATLSSLANTISRALTDILTLATIYKHDGLEDPSVSVNTEFEEPELVQGELTELGVEVAAGRMSFDTYFSTLKKNKVYPPEWTKEQEIAAIEQTAKMIANNRTQIPGLTF